MKKSGYHEAHGKMSLEDRIKKSLAATKNRKMSKHCIFMFKQQKLNEINGFSRMPEDPEQPLQ